MNRIPSIKTLLKIKYIDKSQARELRDLLIGKTDPSEYIGKWYADAPNTPSDKYLYVLLAANKIMIGNGVEHIAQGHNQKSPSISYVNLDDSYDISLMRITGKYVVGCWRDIVEKGNYD